MRKEYISPRLLIGEMTNEVSLLQSSYVDIDGKTDRFDAKRSKFNEEEMEEFEELEREVE